MFPDLDKNTSPELDKFLNSINQSDVKFESDDMLDEVVELDFIKHESPARTPAIEEIYKPFDKSRTPEKPKNSIFTTIFGFFIMIGFGAVFLLAAGYAYAFGVAPLETFMPSLLAYFVFALTFIFFSPLSAILVIIGLFMDSTPPAWIGLLVLLPGIPFMLAKSGIGLVKTVYSKIRV